MERRPGGLHPQLLELSLVQRLHRVARSTLEREISSLASVHPLRPRLERLVARACRDAGPDTILTEPPIRPRKQLAHFSDPDRIVTALSRLLLAMDNRITPTSSRLPPAGPSLDWLRRINRHESIFSHNRPALNSLKEINRHRSTLIYSKLAWATRKAKKLLRNFSSPIHCQ
jgi:hypothetical protein